MKLAILLAALALTACASDRAYFGAGQRHPEVAALDSDAMMNAVCVVKMRRPITQEWRSYCERRGVRGT